ncbi:hypothetical protein [Aliterella atlantica]|uniref:hypothetical protein n=1 Tax=Aliterella atlantica TaxID=1827278 RepID=UPI0006984126|nr:hypothetical protein [Aliterella atlantica]
MQSELDKVLSELYTSNKKLAEQLLERQVISANQLEKLLGDEQLPLGQLLVEEKLIFQYELKKALLEQQFSGRRLGEILVDQQAISAEQLEKILRKQAWQLEQISLNNSHYLLSVLFGELTL